MRATWLSVLLALAACDDDPPPGVGASCGGFTGAICNDGLYCDYADDTCGAADGAGVCRDPDDCEDGALVCGCDGELHASPCAAAAAGVDVSTSDSCLER
jgi:hypothetical protein